MPISPISFGKVVKVHAPDHIVQKICDMANNTNLGDQLTQEIKYIFPDRFEGGVQKYKNYLLSGEDSETAKLYYLIMPTQEMYEKSMDKFVKTKPYLEEMTVAHNGHRVKAVDIII